MTMQSPQTRIVFIPAKTRTFTNPITGKTSEHPLPYDPAKPTVNWLTEAYNSGASFKVQASAIQSTKDGVVALVTTHPPLAGAQGGFVSTDLDWSRRTSAWVHSYDWANNTPLHPNAIPKFTVPFTQTPNPTPEGAPTMATMEQLYINTALNYLTDASGSPKPEVKTGYVQKTLTGKPWQAAVGLTQVSGTSNPKALLERAREALVAVQAIPGLKKVHDAHLAEQEARLKDQRIALEKAEALQQFLTTKESMEALDMLNSNFWVTHTSWAEALEANKNAPGWADIQRVCQNWRDRNFERKLREHTALLASPEAAEALKLHNAERPATAIASWDGVKTSYIEGWIEKVKVNSETTAKQDEAYRERRREELAETLSWPGWTYGHLTSVSQKAIDYIIDTELATK